MESLYILVPLSVLLILAIIGLFAWALNSGQFDDLAQEGERVLQDIEQSPVSRVPIDTDQPRGSPPPEQ